jgi:hypothetical protein
MRPMRVFPPSPSVERCALRACVCVSPSPSVERLSCYASRITLFVKPGTPIILGIRGILGIIGICGIRGIRGILEGCHNIHGSGIQIY